MKQYPYSWQVVKDGMATKEGNSSNPINAERSAISYINRITGRELLNARCPIIKQGVIKQGGKKALLKKVVEREKQYSYRIIEN